MEKHRQVKVYEVRLCCDECEEEMKEVEPGVVLTTFPPRYAYHCVNPECSSRGRIVYDTHLYPYTYHEAEESV